MKIEIIGQVQYISEPKEISGKEQHFFKTIWLKTLENSYIAINAWDEKMEKVDEYKVKDIVTLNCRVESHQNKKREGLHFHKIFLT